jgi:hypothetical protein
MSSTSTDFSFTFCVSTSSRRSISSKVSSASFSSVSLSRSALIWATTLRQFCGLNKTWPRPIPRSADHSRPAADPTPRSPASASGQILCSRSSAARTHHGSDGALRGRRCCRRAFATANPGKIVKSLVLLIKISLDSRQHPRVASILPV